MARRSWWGWLVAIGVLHVAAIVLDVWLATSAGVAREAMVVDRLTFVAYAAMGAVVVRGHPRHRLGWVFLVIGAIFALDRFAEAYGLAGVLGGLPLPAAWTALWASNWAWVVILELLVLSLLWVPDGRLPSRRWRLPGVVAATAGVVLWASAAFSPVPILDQFPETLNPYGIGGPVGDVLLTVGFWAYPWFAGALAAAALVPVVRFRRATRLERRQLAGHMVAALVFVPSFLGWQLAGLLGAPEAVRTTLDVTSSVAIFSLPLALWVAVLGHRLFDVERALVEVLSGALVVAVASVVYAATVAVAGLAVGRAGTVDVAVAVAATALAATLLRPVHDRVRDGLARRLLNHGQAPGGEAVPASIRIQLLGPFQVAVDGVPVPGRSWGSRKARTLVKVLAVRLGRPTTREHLMEVLWPDGDPAQGGPRLSVLLSTVRAVLDRPRGEGAAPALVADREAVALAADVVEVDAHRFLAEVADGAAALADGRHDDARALLERAVGRHGGELLEEDAYEPWVEQLRNECRDALVRAHRVLAELAAADADLDRAVRHHDVVLGADPHDERSHVALVDLLVAAGRHGEARRRHAAYVAFTEELGLEPRPFPGRGRRSLELAS